MKRIWPILLALSACSPSVAAPPQQTQHPRLLLPALRGELDRRLHTPAWKKLREWCDDHKGADVWWPDKPADNDHGRIASGYQGGDYFLAIVNLGLCWQMTHDRGYAQTGVDVLVKMSEPSGAHAVNALTDEGYGVRFYGVGMALGYDWFYDALSAEQKKRVYTALDHWLAEYERGGFAHDHPVGNYFAGYYAAKAMAPLATEGDDPAAADGWRDFLERVHGKMVQPYFSKYLRGGGWPEGWNYGALATLNMSIPILAIKTAKNIDLLNGFRFPVEQAEQLMAFTWPTRRTLDDRGAQFASENPSHAPASLFTVMSGLLQAWHEPLAPAFHRYAREVRANDPEPAQAWQEFLFWDENAPEADYRSRPLSYWSQGLNTTAMRSSWDKDATWASFTSGTYNTNFGAGEMYFDQGSLAVVRGAQRLLVNSVAGLLRNSPGTNDGDRNSDPIYDDLFGNNDAFPTQKNRTIFNVFYAHASQYGQIPVAPGDARTRLDRFEDGGAYLLARGTNLEEMYRQPHHAARPVTRWTRQVTYLRPSLFVVDDWTRIADPNNDQWLAFHVAANPTAAGTGYVVGAAGSITPILPASHNVKVVDVFGKHKVWRLEVRPGEAGVEQRWLTVVDAGAHPTKLSPLAVQSGGMVGVLAGNQAVLSPLGERAEGEIRYSVPLTTTGHFVSGLPPGQPYSVAISTVNGQKLVRITPGGSTKASAAGVLTFN